MRHGFTHLAHDGSNLILYAECFCVREGTKALETNKIIACMEFDLVCIAVSAMY